MTRFFASILAVLLACACGAPIDSGTSTGGARPTQASMGADGEAVNAGAGRPPGPPEPIKPKPWTDAFLVKSMVLADEVSIEGPPGLLDHLLLRSDDALFERVVKTTSEGLSITITPRLQGELVRAQLDRWHFSALRSLQVLERPGGSVVKVVARGQALWQDMDGGEKRMNELVWEGEIQ